MFTYIYIYIYIYIYMLIYIYMCIPKTPYGPIKTILVFKKQRVYP